MGRFKGPDFGSMTKRQQQVAEEILRGPRGAATGISGLMGLWLHNPDLATRSQRVGEFLRFHGTLPDHLRELCILMVARDWRCFHEWIIHKPIALKSGLSADMIEAIRVGDTPRFSEERDQYFYRYVSQMLEKRRVEDLVYQRVAEAEGLVGIIEIAGIIGHYIIGAATLNAAEFDLPAGEEAPF